MVRPSRASPAGGSCVPPGRRRYRPARRSRRLFGAPGRRRLSRYDTLAVTSALAAYWCLGGPQRARARRPGPGFSTNVLGASIECGKLRTVAFLARHRSELPRAARIALAALVVIIAGMNGTGVYSQLVAQHAGERGAL
jgi:hypothetical protein